ncbi:S1 family peptidase [Eleftheria terrae]|uniref:S1 family peptidase n=1 Tax=Eleftheria terrae TaxID=1597781 RepID=UPI00263B8962|nr:serine protease [Eleftheria terrae]WKB53888.1 serine protease [Eleftheria terrae]
MSVRRTVETILLTSVRVATFQGQQSSSSASGFFFKRDDRLYLVTSRHVLADAKSGHHPDRLELDLHTDAVDLTQVTTFSILLYRDGQSIWRQAQDTGGEVDVAVIELDQRALPQHAVLHCFTPAHLLGTLSSIEVGTPLLVVGFPLGFHDTLHRLPVVRLACVASSFGVRFQGQGYFLTDARTHRGTSGAPVVMRKAASGSSDDPLPWALLGIHSSRMDMGDRDLAQDEALGLNSAWYADILMTLTQP